MTTIKTKDLKEGTEFEVNVANLYQEGILKATFDSVKLKLVVSTYSYGFCVYTKLSGFIGTVWDIDEIAVDC